MKKTQFKGQSEVEMDALDTAPHVLVSDLLSVDSGLWLARIHFKDRATTVRQISSKRRK